MDWCQLFKPYRCIDPNIKDGIFYGWLFLSDKPFGRVLCSDPFLMLQTYGRAGDLLNLVVQ